MVVNYCWFQMFTSMLWVLKVVVGRRCAIETVDELVANTETLEVTYYPGNDSADDKFEASDYT